MISKCVHNNANKFPRHFSDNPREQHQVGRELRISINVSVVHKEDALYILSLILEEVAPILCKNETVKEPAYLPNICYELSAKDELFMWPLKRIWCRVPKLKYSNRKRKTHKSSYQRNFANLGTSQQDRSNSGSIVSLR